MMRVASLAEHMLRGLALLLLAASGSAWAKDCSEYPDGIIDGATGIPAPDQIQIDRYCTIRNFPADNPLRTNFSFLTQPGQTDERWIVVFDNVVHTGQMACNSVAGHKIWFTNGSSTSIQEGCQNLLIPVEKIDKQNPTGQITAAIGVPFTYRLTMPVLFDPATGSVINTAGSVNTLHGVTLVDDLNESGVDLQYVGHTAYWQDSGETVAHTFTNIGGVLTFDNFPIVPAGEQIIVELTVVLTDTPANVIGTQFVNRATWDFGRLIDGEFFEPLPGEWGISAPLTIAGPNLVMTKSGPQTMNFGQVGSFRLDIRNAGNSGAWQAQVVDRLPQQMCDAAPQITGAQVFAADGVTPVPGKGALNAGSDYTVSFDAPACELQLNLLSETSVVGGGERLIIDYQSRLDDDATNGATLTNVAGVVRWFNDDVANPGRLTYDRPLTDGTVGVEDHEDAHQLQVDITGYFFEKTVQNLTTGANPAATAVPGDTLRYTLTLRTTDSALSNFTLRDDLGALNAEPVFTPGSLSLVAASIPPGAATGATDANGGTNSAGWLEIGNLNVPANASLSVSFDVTLSGSIVNGTVVMNQAQLDSALISLASDDPNINGIADPNLAGDEDETRVVITSAPYLQIEKTSTYLDGDLTVLEAGERLRYNIVVRNTGTEDTTDALLRDQIPANTSYIAASTMMNGSPVPDVNGTSALTAGLLLQAPGASAPGVVPADAGGAAQNTVTLQFDVIVDAGLTDGSVVSNQAFIDAVAAGMDNIPSDDPRTPVADDPTRDVVGNVPLLFARKSVVLQVDNDTPGTIDPGDTLRYTIDVYNTGNAPATNATLRDDVPNDTSYVAGSTLLNGLAVADAPGGALPLQSGLPVSSSDLTPPLPGVGEGRINVGQAMQLVFDVVIDANTPRGTVIANQARVATDEQGVLLTDGDGNPATGPEPTLVVVGDAARLSILKQVAVVGGGPAEAGATVEYLIQVRNISNVPAYNVYVTDDLDYPEPDQLQYVAGSATLNGAAAGINFAPNVLTANYTAVAPLLQPDSVMVVRFHAVINEQLAIGTTVTNAAEVAWNNTETASASVSFDVGGVPGSGAVTGTVWHDENYDNLLDAQERVLPGWRVELYRNDAVLVAAVTDINGVYAFTGLPPNYLTEDTYRLRFIAPGAGPNSALLGEAYSEEFTNDLQEIRDIVLREGDNLLNLDMPIDPNGVVYHALTRAPIGGVTLTLVDTVSGTPIPASCLDDPNQQGQVTTPSGYYKFDLNFESSGCSSGSAYSIRISIPGGAFVDGYSELIPPSSSPAQPLQVPSCPGSAADAVPATSLHCEAQASAAPPNAGVPFQSPATQYFVDLVLDDSDAPGSSQLFNNHLPVDPVLTGVIRVTKVTPMVNVSRGQLVPYVITVRNTYEIELADIDVIDAFPPGFQYVEGSARLDGEALEPTLQGRTLVWDNLTLGAETTHTMELLLGVGAGVSEGEFVNRAYAQQGATGEVLSNQASATVRLVPDPSFDCTDVIGKVYDDANRNGLQDQDEDGIANVRLVTARGLAATTDAYGRFHFTCPIVPNETRGSNFVLKLDDRTLPSGYRASSDLVRVQRATRGKTLRFNFGASIHRVVGLDVADAVFYPGSADIRPQWLPRFTLLMDELQKAPASLRVSYLADTETEALVERRLAVVKHHIEKTWQELDCCYRLVVEPEVFWRLGGPAAEVVRAAVRGSK